MKKYRVWWLADAMTRPFIFNTDTLREAFAVLNGFYEYHKVSTIGDQEANLNASGDIEFCCDELNVNGSWCKWCDNDNLSFDGVMKKYNMDPKPYFKKFGKNGNKVKV